jgi:LuxR family maltose regulon positive regulatory protein
MPRKTAPLAKLLRPQLHRPVERERLFRLVDQRALHPVLWVCGPPGCGKTTLVASLSPPARSARSGTGSTREIVTPPHSSHTSMSSPASWVALPPRTCRPLTPEFFPDLPAFTRRCFRELFARLSRRSMLVLDNCHVAASDTFHLLLRCACQELPPGITLIAISRGRRPRELTQLVASRSLLEIDWDDLRFQPDEAIALGRGLGVRDRQVVEDYLARCNGWAAGLVLLAASRGRSTPAQRDRFRAESDVFEYFATELLADMPQTQRSTLLATALLPQMNAATACELTGNSRAGELLESLHRQQYFTDSTAGEEPVYRYHDLFRDFLLARLASSTDPAELCGLRSRAGRLLETREQLGEAILLYRLSDQWPDVARLIRGHAECLLDQGQWRTLNDWFEGLPQNIVEADPWLLYWRAQGLLTLDVVQARHMVRRAYQDFLRDGDTIGQVYAIYSLIDLHWLVGELADHGLNAAFLEVLERHLSHPEALTPPAQHRAWDALAQIILWGGRHSPFMGAAADALERYMHDDALPWSQRLVAPTMSLVYAIATADQERGQRISRAISPHLEEPACSPVSRMWAAKLLGRWHFHGGEWDRAIHFAAQCQTLASRCKHPTQAIDAGCTRISALCVSGRHQEARAVLESILLDQGSAQPLSMGLKHKAQALLLANTGAFDRAIPHQLQAIELIASVGCEWFVAEGHMLIAVYQISLDRLEEGRRSLMRQAMSLKGVRIPLLLPEVTIDTSRTDYRPIESMRYMRFDGHGWRYFGDLVTESSPGVSAKQKRP